jgi:hypothetical protein
MAKRNEIDELEKNLEKYERESWKKGRKLVKKWSKIIVNWLFFYQPEDQGHAMFHILDVIAIIYLIIRLAGR